jgi:hypothetical protein
MSILRELADTRQVAGEPRRRWFCSPELDLIVWMGGDEKLIGFQLCYDKHVGERALTWRIGRGYDHAAIDAGETVPSKYKGTPILVADGAFQHERVAAIFREASVEVPEHIRAFVAQAIANYPRGGSTWTGEATSFRTKPA